MKTELLGAHMGMDTLVIEVQLAKETAPRWFSCDSLCEGEEKQETLSKARGWTRNGRAMSQEGDWCEAGFEVEVNGKAKGVGAPYRRHSQQSFANAELEALSNLCAELRI